MSNASELKKCVKLACSVAHLGEKVLGAGNIVGKLGELVSAAPTLLPLIGINLAEAKTELGALDEAARTELLAEVKADLQLENQALELNIEEALQLAEDGYEYVQKVLAFAHKLKPASPVTPVEPVPPAAHA